MSKVSIILTSYNHAKFLKESIDSVLNQTFTDFELIIWDDASIDNSWEIIQSYSDPRIKSFRNENNIRGTYGINKSIQEVSSGEYIAIHHSDDVWMPDKLEKQVNFLDTHPEYGAVFCNAEIIREDGLPLNNPSHPYSRIFTQENRHNHEWLKRFIDQGNCLCHPSAMVRKEAYLAVGPYNNLLGALGDFEMWVRICIHYNIYVMSDKLVNFRILDNEQNTSGNSPSNRIRYHFEFPKILDCFCAIEDLSLFNKIFSSDLDNPKQIALFLVHKAITDSHIFMQNWGLQKAYSLLRQDYEYYSQFINNMELISLSGNIDIHQLFKRH